MNIKLSTGFALRNIKANRYLEIPFILSTGIMLILFNIMSSLLQNEYVLTRHKNLPLVINMGIGISFIFTFVFVLYANRFLIKRRNKEFALYGILGLEKKHIRKIIFIEHIFNYSLIAVIAIVGGFIFGKIAFLGLNRLLADTTGTIMDYPFSRTAMIITLVYTVFLFIVMYLINALSIRNASPVELLGREHRGEGEPKNRIFLLAVGIIFLMAGYGIALTIEGTMQSLLFFFFAAVLVIFATYILFISFSIFILKIQKNNKGFYYKDKNFLAVSGMLYRMKSSAAGLASITILSTGVIITLAATLSIYGGIEAVVNTSIHREYSISAGGENGEITVDNYKKEEALITGIVYKAAGSKENISDMYKRLECMAPAVLTENEFLPLTRENMNAGKVVYLIFTTLESYNEEFSSNEKLSANEVLISANNSNILPEGELILNGEKYIANTVKNHVPGNLAVESFEIVVQNAKYLDKFASYYVSMDLNSKKYIPSSLNLEVNFNLDYDKSTFEKEFLKLANDNLSMREYDEMRKSAYELNGGFLFLGIITGLIFLSGTMLITYYKQISEGAEDREKYQIMKRVGLPDELIKKTASSQIVWMFFLPLFVAMVHSLVSSKILYQLLGLFGIHQFSDYGSRLFTVGAVFMIIYFINFKITSNVYYKQVR